MADDKAALGGSLCPICGFYKFSCGHLPAQRGEGGVDLSAPMDYGTNRGMVDAYVGGKRVARFYGEEWAKKFQAALLPAQRGEGDLLPCHECNGTGLIGMKVGARHLCNLCEGEGKFRDRRTAIAALPRSGGVDGARVAEIRERSLKQSDFSVGDQAQCERDRADLLKYIAALPRSTEGWQYVPVVPDAEQMEAAKRAIISTKSDTIMGRTAEIYTAMVKAKSAPAAGAERSGEDSGNG